MNIVWDIHLYPPKHNCGSELMAHNINKFLIGKGHGVKVVLQQAHRHGIKNAYDWEGVTVFPPLKDEIIYRMADVIITHLDYTSHAISMGIKYKKPVIHFVHNDCVYDSIMNNPQVNVVYNSQWIREKLNYVNNSFVLTPPVDYRYYEVETGEYITLINLDWNKGGEVLQKIALALPDKKFLGVVGSYSYDGRGQYTNQPPNVTVIPNTPDILEVYRKTRVLIMPSHYESWGRTATEAMCSGIPVISSSTPGLKENLGKAGLFIEDRDDIDAWVKMIKKLDDKAFYKKASDKARARSRELDPVAKMEEFEKWLTNLKR